MAAELERHFPTTPHSETVSARLQARWDADPHDPIFRFTWADGTVGYMPRPADSAIGSDCLAWRKKILNGEPLFKVKEPRNASPNWGRVLKPVLTVWRRHPSTFHFDALDPTKRIRNPGTAYWEHDSERQKTVPVRVRCPSCNRPIRLSRWWEHGCEKGIVTSDWCFAPWAEATAGAAEPVYDDETTPTTIVPVTATTVDEPAETTPPTPIPRESADPVAETGARDWMTPGRTFGSYRTQQGELVTMYRWRQHVRFYTDGGRQIGPEQSNVVPGVAYAMAQGWESASKPPPPCPAPPVPRVGRVGKLTPEQASELRRRANRGESPRALMAEFGISSRGYFYKLKAGVGRARWAEVA
jgi:hypothetical protein